MKFNDWREVAVPRIAVIDKYFERLCDARRVYVTAHDETESSEKTEN